MADEIFILVRDQQIPELTEVLQKNASGINKKNAQGQTPLYWACELPTANVAKLLLQFGADLTIAEQYGFTPLHLSSFVGNEAVVKLLLEYKAEVNRKNNSGGTPLHLAAKNGHFNIVTKLLAAGADANIKDDKGMLPADYAKTHPNILAILQERMKPVPRESAPAASPTSPSTAPAAVASPSTAHSSASSSKDSTSSKVAQLKKTIQTTDDINILRKISTFLQDSLVTEQTKLFALQKAVLDEKQKNMCLQCNTEAREVVLVPCMHLVYCGKCFNNHSLAQHAPSCAACNTSSTGFIHITKTPAHETPAK